MTPWAYNTLWIYVYRYVQIYAADIYGQVFLPFEPALWALILVLTLLVGLLQAWTPVATQRGRLQRSRAVATQRGFVARACVRAQSWFTFAKAHGEMSVAQWSLFNLYYASMDFFNAGAAASKPRLNRVPRRPFDHTAPPSSAVRVRSTCRQRAEPNPQVWVDVLHPHLHLRVHR